MQEAVAADSEFAQTFNDSNEPYKVAYEYLTKKSTEVKSKKDSYEADLKAQWMKEMGLEKKEPKEVPPSMSSVGSSSGSDSDDTADGFISFFNGR